MKPHSIGNHQDHRCQEGTSMDKPAQRKDRQLGWWKRCSTPIQNPVWRMACIVYYTCDTMHCVTFLGPIYLNCTTEVDRKRLNYEVLKVLTFFNNVYSLLYLPFAVGKILVRWNNFVSYLTKNNSNIL